MPSPASGGTSGLPSSLPPAAMPGEMLCPGEGQELMASRWYWLVFLHWSECSRAWLSWGLWLGKCQCQAHQSCEQERASPMLCSGIGLQTQAAAECWGWQGGEQPLGWQPDDRGGRRKQQHTPWRVSTSPGLLGCQAALATPRHPPHCSQQPGHRQGKHNEAQGSPQVT